MVDGRRHIFLILFCKIQLCLFFFFLRGIEGNGVLVLAVLSAVPQSCSEEAKLFTGGRERFLPTCSCLPGHKEMHASPAMQKTSTTSFSSLTGSFQKVIRHISDITRLFLDVSISACQDMSSG